MVEKPKKFDIFEDKNEMYDKRNDKNANVKNSFCRKKESDFNHKCFRNFIRSLMACEKNLR